MKKIVIPVQFCHTSLSNFVLGFLKFFLLLNCVYHASTIGLPKNTDTSVRPRALTVSSVATTVLQFLSNVMNNIKQFIMSVANYIKTLMNGNTAISTRSNRMSFDGLLQKIPIVNHFKTISSTTVPLNTTTSTSTSSNSTNGKQIL